MRKIFFFAAALAVFSCGEDRSVGDDAEACARMFGESYFNFRLHRALDLCTPESERWVRLLASNLTQDDLDLYNAQAGPARVQVEGLTFTSDTTAEALLSVADFVQLGAIGRPASVVSEGQVSLRLVRRQGEWLVRMEGPLRSERQSRD